MLVAALLAAGSTGLILMQSFHGTPEEAGAYAVMALALELTAPRLARFGFFSLASGPLLALALRAPQSVAVAVLASLGCLLIRTLLRGASTIPLRLAEALCDYLPFVLAAVVSTKFHSGTSPLGYIAPAVLAFVWITSGGLVSGSLTDELREEFESYRSRLSWGGLAAGGSALVLASTAAPAVLVGTFVMLMVLSRAAHLAVASADVHARKLAQREKERELTRHQEGLKVTEEVLRQTGQVQQRSAAELEVRLAAYTLVEEMLEGISLRPVLKDVAATIVERLRRKVRCQSIVVFWKVEDALAPLAHRSPVTDRLQASSLFHFSEPVVLRAHKLNRVERQLPEDANVERIFPDEAYTLAIPMRDRGVIYFGSPKNLEIDDEARHFLQVVANHAVIAMGAADFYQRLEESLQREAAAASRNEALVHRLAQVIDGVTQIVHLRDPEQMLERTGLLLEHLIPHHLRLLWRAGDEKTQSAPLLKGSPTRDNAVMADYAQTVRSNGRPLLLEAFEAGRFPAPAVGSTALLAVPINSESGPIGAVVLVRQGGEPFERQDQDILSVMVYQLSAALLSAQLYSQLQEAHVALKDSQAQVVQSSKMAAIGQLAGGVAHELNTPLGAIALAIDGALVALHNKPERAESRLNRASTSVQQMKEIVSKLLFYSRDARSGRRETDLNKVIDDTLQLIGHQLRLDNVQVETRFGDLPTFVANQNELQQVFTNLCLNARDAVIMPEATERKILITTSREGDWLKATVRDWGCGMPAAVKEKIFDPFYTTKDVGKGTGLGLSVTLQLVEQHNARISVESEPGVGTQFTLMLPLNPPEEV